MTSFVLGADRDRLRFLLWQGKRLLADTTIAAPAKERQEARLIWDWLRKRGIEAGQVECFGLLAVPHSKTSVRVAATILGALGWYHGRPVVSLSVDELDQLLADQILQRLSTQSTGRSFTWPIPLP